MAQIKLSKDIIGKIMQVCDEYHNDSNNLITVLHKVQGMTGYLPAEVQEVVAQGLRCSVAQVYGVVSFYSFFTMVPKGEHSISMCLGTACFVRGSQAVLDELKKQLNIDPGEVTPDGKFSLDCLRCVGACGLAPVVMVGEKVYGSVTVEQVKDILDEYR